MWPGDGGIRKREGGRCAEDGVLQALRVRDEIASRELCASRMSVEAETPAEVRDMLPRHLVHQNVHELVGIDPSTAHLPVAAEIASAEYGRHNYRMMCFGESRPTPYGSPCVLGEIVFRS